MANEAVLQGPKSDVQPTALAKPIDAYPSIVEFLSGCKSKYTAKGYKTGLNKFFNFCAVDNNEFDPEVAIKLRPEVLNPIVLKYAMHLKKVAKTSTDFKRGEISVNSVSFYLSPVKKFFDYYELDLSWKKFRRFIPEETVRHYHVYNKDELRKMLAVANHRERVIVLILLTSGMRAQALVGLQIRDFEVMADNIGHLVPYARTRDYYHTFCTPECTAAIKFYLDWRKEMGEVEKGQELSATAPLIRDSIKDGFSKSTKKPHTLSYMRLWEIMQKLLRKAGIDNANIQPNHSFRKYMNTVIANAKTNPLFKEIMLGHTLKLDEFYYDREDPQSMQALMSEYIKAVDVLTINDEYRLKIENTNLKEQLSQTAPKDMVADLMMQNKALMDRQAKMEEDNKKRDVMFAEWMKGRIQEGKKEDTPSP